MKSQLLATFTTKDNLDDTIRKSQMHIRLYSIKYMYYKMKTM